ncbi:hypothetical protein [Bacillus sp. NPDC094106]|uniref:ADP-ribosyltransferase-containing protein n=1 Tax=Bacillus sp. NPDC094106 TaxID=3363949 RepID=UPI00380DE58F
MINEMVYHGRENHGEINDNVVFFSSNKDFSRDYGEVKRYNLALKNPFDSCSKKDIEFLLNMVGVIVDSYDDLEYRNYDDIEKTGLLYADTWSMFESYMSQIERLGYDGMIIYEGGIQNFVSFDSKQYKQCI